MDLGINTPKTFREILQIKSVFHLIIQNLDGSISFENTNLDGSISFSQDTEGGGIDMLLSCL
jgi:hypothetical protein